MLQLSLFVFSSSSRAGDDGDDAQLKPTPDDNLYDTDRPGELENPFTLPPGRTELVNYLVSINSAAREDDFDAQGSAVFLDTAVRFGVANRLEGVFAVDSFLHADFPPQRGGSAVAGVGYASLFAKWNFLADASGDYGVAIAPFARLPLKQSIAGTSRAESGLVVPFDVDLEGGWELQGSIGAARSPDGSSWSTEYQSQAELERTLSRSLTAYLELELEAGADLPQWSTELGIICQLGKSAHLDLGATLGLGRNSRGRGGYLGLGWPL